MSKSITLVGSANVDFVMKMPRLPVKGETVSGGEFGQAFGGKGSNQALAARRSGGAVNMVASLGDDSFGKQFLELYRSEGINTENVTLHDGISCGTAIIQVDRDGNNTIAIAAGANGLLSPGQVDAAEKAIASSAIVMLQMEVPDDATIRCIELAARHNVDVMLNYAPCRQSSLMLSDKVTILVVNETEASELSGLPVNSIPEAESAARKLAENGHRLVVVTLGAAGSLVLENDAVTHFPAFTINAVDATAAGDSYCGALATAFAEGKPLGDAVRFATAAGALSASRFGAVPSIPTRQEIDGFLNQA